MASKKIESALISVYHKDNLENILKLLGNYGIKLYSTGGTFDFIKNFGLEVSSIEDLTSYPSILGGRVKTLHPQVMGGILFRRNQPDDQEAVKKYNIPSIDLVIVDLYPFEETVSSGADEFEIIEKIDIGGIALIRAAAKNFNDVLIVPGRRYYQELLQLLEEKEGTTSLNDRKKFAAYAFGVSSHYDTQIFKYYNQEQQEPSFRESYTEQVALRYGENPHQKGRFFGSLSEVFTQLNGKELSYNNLVDVESAIELVSEFENEKAFVIIKHTNACGVATADNLKTAYLNALAGDPVSAFGGVLATNTKVDLASAEEINQLFFEILIAPDFDEDALKLLKSKKNRILLKKRNTLVKKTQFKSLLNGVLEQDKDLHTDTREDLKIATRREPSEQETDALLFASKICKHTKSNTIVLAKDGQLLASGVGQTSRVDALVQAIEKAKRFGFSLHEAVMASDAFFPFPDCVQIASAEGIKAVIQPGGSIKDQDSIDYCNQHEMAMVFTGFRHFKH